MQTVVWKIILIIVLFISFIFFSITVVESLQNRTLTFQPGPESRKKEQSLPPPAEEIRFYPSVPEKMPNLNVGYLFNQERLLGLPETIDGAAVDDPLAIDMDAVRYAGSLINGSTRKGLIRYPAARTPIKRGPRVIIAKRAIAEKWSSKIVEEGETVSGYRVVSISAQTIVFEQGGRRLEKKLYTPDKERIAFIPPMNRFKEAKKTAIRKTRTGNQQATRTGTRSITRVKTPITKRSAVRN